MTIIEKRKTRTESILDFNDIWNLAVKYVSKNLKRQTSDNIAAINSLLPLTFESQGELIKAIKNAFYGGNQDKKRSKEYYLNFLGWTDFEYQKHYDRGPRRISYWLNLGYSEATAKLEVEKTFRKSSIFCVEHWISKYDLTVEEAKSKISEIQSKNSQKVSNKIRCENSPRRKEYWLKRGFSEESSENQVSTHQINSSPRRKEFWLLKGKTLEEAEFSVKEFQGITLDKLIIKYGEILGRERYENWRTSKNRIEAAKKNLLNIGGGFSKESQELFNLINSNYTGDIFYATFNREDIERKNKEFVLKFEDGSWIRPDFIDIDKKKIIEYDGEYWHNINGGDNERDEKIKAAGYDILRITDVEFHNNPNGALETCLNFLQN